ncbi:protease B nonderepressible form [Lithohypha guttulata]|uniref:Protein PBN1 n=1 Tax=Lithohypha guttulata TaxID=1690604 RepID=A0AAN7T504_9EURO|nr:protease B nonderepressible form [Lithohypha guttulata]
MRRRSTFIPPKEVDYDPSEIRITEGSLSFAGLQAAREERLTFGLNELPAEIVDVLQRSHELHVRWATERAYDKSSPYLSSISPGLHVSYTPLSDRNNDKLCPLLHRIFSESLRCVSPEISFSRPDILSERFASAAALQYYSLLPSLEKLVTWIQEHVCPPSGVGCRHNAALLNSASYVDIDYDSISHALTFAAFWSEPPTTTMGMVEGWQTYNNWNILVDPSPSDRNEVGILKASPGSEAAQIEMEGILTVVGEDNSPKPTRFFFPSRHHALSTKQDHDQSYTVSFDEPTGLHPTMRIRFPAATVLQEPASKAADSTCALHAYLTLPSTIFADEYAFPTTDIDPPFTEAHNIVSLRSLSGERDLEAPDYVIHKWGSAMLLELATPTSAQQIDTSWDVTIPLHLRYLKPTSGGKQHIEIPWPVVFWACTADEGTKFTVNPFDRINLAYDGLFGPRTMFYHLEPQPVANQKMLEAIDVPVLDTNVMTSSMAELLTLLLVTSGFLWVTWKVSREISWEWNWWSRTDARKGKAVTAEETKKSN